MNRHSVHKTGIGPLKTATSTLILEDAEKAELLNSYFVSVCTKDNDTLLAQQDFAADGNKLTDVSFRVQQIQRILKKQKRKTSAGPDGFPSLLFNQLAPQLAYPLFLMYNIFMKSGNVPEIWKQANVTPIFKKGVSSDPKNYRPISLTCVCSKVFESVIKTVLVQYFEERHL